MKLSAYLSENRISVAAFAKLAGVERQTVYSWIARQRNKRKLPSPDSIKKINTITGGAVQANDFHDAPKKRTASFAQANGAQHG